MSQRATLADGTVDVWGIHVGGCGEVCTEIGEFTRGERTHRTGTFRVEVLGAKCEIGNGRNQEFEVVGPRVDGQSMRGGRPSS